jgi:hypothetical protein
MTTRSSNGRPVEANFKYVCLGFGRSGKLLIDDSVQTKVAFKTAASCTGKINAEKSRIFITLRSFPVSFEPLPQKHGSILGNPSFRNATI